MIKDIHIFMRQLAKSRPLFHSEADFQHTFAWQLHQQFPDSRIRLEYPVKLSTRIYVDIWLTTDQLTLAIELKYKTKLFNTTHDGEDYMLKMQGAQDLGRYDFLKDVQRLEQIIEQSTKRTMGFAILLTNDPLYWKSAAKDTIDADFRLDDSREISGVLSWREDASEGTMHKRQNPIVLRNRYRPQWQSYHDSFRYLALALD